MSNHKLKTKHENKQKINNKHEQLEMNKISQILNIFYNRKFKLT